MRLPPATAQPSGAQPWSERVRGATTANRQHRTGRRRQLSRFNHALADHIRRETEDEQQVTVILTVALRMLWPSFILAGGVLVGKLTGRSGYSIPELSLGFGLSIMLGVAAARIERSWRGESAPDAATDRNQPDTTGFISLRRTRERDRDE